MPPGTRGPSRSHHTTPRNTHRGGIRKSSPLPRIERDGDLVMDGAGDAKGSSSSHNRGSTSNPSRRGSHSNRNQTRNNPNRDQKLAKAISRSLNDGRDINVRDAPSGPRNNKPLTTSRQHDFDQYDQIVIRGWKQSSASTNPDQGIPQLIEFINRKASKAAKLDIIRESQVRGDNFFIYTKPEYRESVLRLNNFQFARATLSVELKREGIVSAKDVKSTIRATIIRRFNEAEKFLDLSNLGSDPELVKLDMFKTQERASKAWTVILTICEDIWPKHFQRNQAVQSISLASNNLESAKEVSVLSQTFSKIRNLDLSNNHLATHKSLENWNRKFPNLDHLILTGNEIEKIPDFHLEILKWFPKLRTLDAVQVRTEDDIPKTLTKIPIAPGITQGDLSIAQGFVQQYFDNFDKQHSMVIPLFYSELSSFTLNVKTNSHGNYKSDPWGKWIGISRNLQKITSVSGRDQRLFSGLQAIEKCFNDMPVTKHPDIGGENEKWLMECHSIQGLTDPTGQSPTGVNGMIITIHGEFQELGPNGQPTAHRSFDRNFVLGPGEIPGSVRIMKEILTLRPYSGHENLKPTISPTIQPQPTADGSIPQIVLNNEVNIPAGLVVPPQFATPLPDKSPEQLQQEILVLELSKATRMTLEYSVQCLQETNWNLENAGLAFQTNKEKLPPTAFW